MSGYLQPPTPSPPNTSDIEDEHEQLRILSRSPHPYHRQSSDLLKASDCLLHSTSASTALDGRALPTPPTKDSTPLSESGTEADDEHFLKGLPAPKARLHKGLRGKNELLSGSSTPFLSPDVLEEEGRKTCHRGRLGRERNAAEKTRRRKELVRRGAEVLLLVCQGGLIVSNCRVEPFIRLYRRGGHPDGATVYNGY